MMLWLHAEWLWAELFKVNVGGGWNFCLGSRSLTSVYQGIEVPVLHVAEGRSVEFGFDCSLPLVFGSAEGCLFHGKWALAVQATDAWKCRVAAGSPSAS